MRVTLHYLLILSFMLASIAGTQSAAYGDADSSHLPLDQSQSDLGDVPENRLKIQFMRAGKDPTARYETGMQLLEFYQATHNFQKASNTFNALVNALKPGMFKVDKSETSEQQQNIPVAESTERDRRTEELAQSRAAAALEAGRRAAEYAETEKKLQELSEASATAVRLSELHKQWIQFLNADGYTSEARAEKAKADYFAERASNLLSHEALFLYRAKRFEEAIAKYKAAEVAAPHGSRQELTAADNVLFPMEKLGCTRDAIWKAKRNAYVLHHKLDGTSIPEEYDGETPDLALEHILIKKADKQALLHFYQSRHQYENARSVFGGILSTIPYNNPRLPELHRKWAEFCDAEGHAFDAENHKKIAASLDSRQANWAKQEIERRRKVEELRRREEALRRRENELQRQRDEQERQKEEARLAADKLEIEARKKKIREANEALLKTRPDIVGVLWRSNLGGAMQFYTSGKCDISPEYTRLDAKTVASIVDGAWTLEPNAGGTGWFVRVTSTFEGTQRVDKWTLVPSDEEEGVINLLGMPAEKPYASLLYGQLRPSIK